MYLPAHFEEKRPEVLHALLRTHPLGLLITQRADGVLAANSVPFVLDADPAGGPGILRAHVARANSLWHDARGDIDSLVVFQGPQAYISPSFYPSKAEHGKVVPTWNYVMVQARGRLRAIDDAHWVHAFVTRLTDRHEAPRAAPWAVTDAPGDYIASMLRAIVGIELVLTEISGKWKVSQNRSAADRAGVAQGLRDSGAAHAAWLAGDQQAPTAHRRQAAPLPLPDRAVRQNGMSSSMLSNPVDDFGAGREAGTEAAGREAGAGAERCGAAPRSL